MAFGLIFICGIIISCYLYLRKKFGYWRSQGIPGSQTIFDGTKEFLDIFKKPLFESQYENYKRYGRIFGTFEGLTPILVVGEPNLVKNILVKDFHIFRNRIEVIVGDSTFEQMLQFARDDTWKRIRCIMTPTFTSGKMRKMSSLVTDCLENLVQHCKLMADRNQVLDCKTYSQAYALDVVASTAFGTKMNSLLDSNNDFAKKARLLSSRDQPLLFIAITLFPFVFKLTGSSFFREIMGYFRDVASHIVDERKKQNKKGHDFLQLMLEAHEGVLEVTGEDIAEMNEEKQVQLLPKHKTLTKDEMLSQCVLFLLVGNETTSTTISFANYLLALNPDCQEKLIQEIDEAWKQHGKMNFDIVNKLPYLDAVISETLRLYPVLFWLVRENVEDYTLEGTGITMKKGSVVHIPVYSMHRDPELFPEPERFNPDRFLPENRHLIQPYSYLPFGEGPRNCIGKRFALMMVKLAMAYLLHDLKIVATEDIKKPLEYQRGQRFMVPKTIAVKMENRNNSQKNKTL